MTQAYFTETISTHGATFKGVGWGSSDRQSRCFKQLMRISEDPTSGNRAADFTLNDYGCGYGALVSYLTEQDYRFSSYTGFEITPAMYDQAISKFGQVPGCRFTTDRSTLEPADYTIASGLLSLKLNHSQETWESYVLSLLNELWALSKHGLAFNSLTKYSDADKMRDDLYYADPCLLFNYCKTHFSKDVALLHDYGLYEFTILVRRTL
jgi:SAM-dependent methyltransferase